MNFLTIMFIAVVLIFVLISYIFIIEFQKWQYLYWKISPADYANIHVLYLNKLNV